MSTITIEPATEQEIADTITVMGGEDWEMWIDALAEAKLLAPGAQSVAYSYIGPEVTWAIYKNGTIGLAKNDLERAAKAIDSHLKLNGGGRAFISVNKALVTQASSAIPVVPLYISILYKIMKAKGTHEGCIEQMQRLFATQIYAAGGPKFDEAGRVRVDDLEMRPDVQAAVARIWPGVTTENLAVADRHRRLPQRVPEALRLRPGRHQLRGRGRAARPDALRGPLSPRSRRRSANWPLSLGPRPRMNGRRRLGPVVRLGIGRRRSSGKQVRSMSVSMTPGLSGTAAMPSGSSSASALVRPSIAHLVAQ